MLEYKKSREPTVKKMHNPQKAKARKDRQQQLRRMDPEKRPERHSTWKELCRRELVVTPRSETYQGNTQNSCEKLCSRRWVEQIDREQIPAHHSKGHTRRCQGISGRDRLGYNTCKEIWRQQESTWMDTQHAGKSGKKDQWSVETEDEGLGEMST